MIDRDGVVRPDQYDAHMVPLLNSKGIQLADDYKFLSKNVFYRFWQRFVMLLAIIFLNPIYYIGYSLKVKNRKNIKKIKKQGAVVVINHVHQFDVAIVGTNIFKGRKIYFTSVKEDFEIPVLRHFLRTLGGIPIPRDVKRMRSFAAAVDEVIDDKKLVIFCGEGSMWPNYRDFRPFKNGAFKFASKHNVPIMPIVFTFDKCKKLFSKTKYKYKIRCHVEEPIYPLEGLEGFAQQDYLKTKTEDLFKTIIEREGK